MPTVFITGANRGLGFEFAAQYLADGWRVLGACRSPQTSTSLSELGQRYDALVPVTLDVADHASIDAAAAELSDQPIDVLINNAGVFGPNAGRDNDWRQNFGHMDYDVWAEVLRINTMGPFKVTEALIGNVAVSEQKKVVTISSNLGSIGDPETGMHFAYRTSKCAVNMVMATLADELKPQDIIVALFDPGWCRTDMGGGGADYDAPDSVRRIRHLIDRLTIADSGRYLRHDGFEHPW